MSVKMDVKEALKNTEIRDSLSQLETPDVNCNEFKTIVQPKSENYSEVGGAFNYTFSFWLAKERGKSEIMRKPHKKCIEDIKENHTQFLPSVDSVLERSEDSVDYLVKKGKTTEQLFKLSLDLARIGAVPEVSEKRAHGLLRRIGNHPKEDVNDLKCLYKNIPESELRPVSNTVVKKHLCPWDLFDYVFADAIINGNLLDIKTTKNPGFSKRLFHKIVLQSYLARKINIPVKYGCVYYSRQSELVKFQIPENIPLSENKIRKSLK